MNYKKVLFLSCLIAMALTVITVTTNQSMMIQLTTGLFMVATGLLYGWIEEHEE